MPRLSLDRTSLSLPGRDAPHSLGGLMPAPCRSWATRVLDTVALDVADGERVALWSSSKFERSLLLGILAGRLTPTTGHRHADGSVVAILDVEASLDEEASGRENLQRLLGARADSAAEMTGLADLLDVPVRFCSPGMRWRIGFAAAAVTSGDVLIVDECLGGADLAFRGKASSRLMQLLDEARLAVVAEPLLFDRCTRVVELSAGRLRERTARREAA